MSANDFEIGVLEVPDGATLIGITIHGYSMDRNGRSLPFMTQVTVNGLQGPFFLRQRVVRPSRSYATSSVQVATPEQQEPFVIDPVNGGRARNTGSISLTPSLAQCPDCDDGLQSSLDEDGYDYEYDCERCNGTGLVAPPPTSRDVLTEAAADALCKGLRQGNAWYESYERAVIAVCDGLRAACVRRLKRNIIDGEDFGLEQPLPVKKTVPVKGK